MKLNPAGEKKCVNCQPDCCPREPGSARNRVVTMVPYIYTTLKDEYGLKTGESFWERESQWKRERDSKILRKVLL